MGLELVDGIARVLACATGAGIPLNVLDDLFVDACYFAPRLDRRSSRVLSEQKLRAVEPKRVAIMLPAWKEADVIEHMLEHNVAKIDYPRDRYDIFCGTYQNDPETQARVDAAARRFPNVHKVVVPHDGPTSKADCLNWVYQGIVLAERQTGRRFDILLMHDAEDVVHPLALRLYSLLIPPNEFVQTPVFSLPLPKRRLVSGTYIDEFAEHHLKDMRVREAIGGLVPSAGVGSAFARDTFQQVAAAHGQQPFNVESLTEDYEIGLKLRLTNRRAHFACHTIERRDGTKRREEFIATREYFPSDFRASVRQRSRWILGIALQTWAQVGWRGALPVLYCLWRDRKAVLTNALLLSAYALALYFGARMAIAHAAGAPWTFADVVPAGSPLIWMLQLNLSAAAWRMGMKARFVWRLYGPAHALLTVPRLLLGNLIGILATIRAVGQYTAYRVGGRPLRWLKTAHDFPAPERLAAARSMLGEYLLEQRALSAAELEEAVALQHATGATLGEVLTIAGMASPSVVTKALGRELDVPTVDSDPHAIPTTLLARVPELLAEELDVLPLAEIDGAVVVASASRLDEGACERLQAALGVPIQMRLASGVALRRARERAYRRLLVHADAEPTQAPPAGAPPPHGDVDGAGVARLGIPFCAFHGVVPLRAVAGAPPRVLCVAPLHDSVRTAVEARLGTTATFEIATTPPALRASLAAIYSSMPNAFDGTGLFGLDAAELDALKTELDHGVDLARLAGDARDQGLSPLEHLEANGAIAPVAIARARARLYGLSLAAEAGSSAAGLLPPRVALTHCVTVVGRSAGAVVLAAPRPTPRLAQEVVSLLSPLKVAWAVGPNMR